ncbi:DEKNAAC101833 [Brettanomyces naardenensis]|uniref:DEKNAAC101833 n=1 Tax=Brettanomyces naardenensis TaxID=13370 RepID=A0A448YJ69_BRENA|nr:DEKNAAC101833 [Brettanomyces naardenensis]
MQSLAPWNPAFSSALATELQTQPFMIFNFSNVGKDRWPSTRCCVLRGFLFDDRSTNVLLFVTDKRSAKYKELLKDPRFEACFYFTKLRKQFRLRGISRIIADDLYPNIQINGKSEEAVLSGAENDDDESNDSFSSSSSSSSLSPSSSFPIFESFPNRDSGSAYDPLEYVVISPSVPMQENLDSSFTSLSDLTHNRKSFEMAKKEYLQAQLKPPSKEEWAQERTRCWEAMSRNMKKAFKKPLPGSLLTENKSKLLDSIDRNVDGTTSSSGFENFAVVCMFVDLVDYLDLGAGGVNSRYVYKRLDGDDWKEYEVCP